MADESKDGGGGSIPWPLLASLLAISGGLFVFYQPLRSARPSAERDAPLMRLGDQDVDARLWQDPFAAAVAHDEKLRATQSASDRRATTRPFDATRHDAQVADMLERVLKEASEDDVNFTIIPVMVDAGAYQDQVEQRLRYRCAVVEALLTCQYAPRDTQAIGYFKVPWQSELDEKASAAERQWRPILTLGEHIDDFWKKLWFVRPETQPRIDTHHEEMLVPFEWFRARHSAQSVNRSPIGGQVLLLWLPQEMFDRSPLARLAYLLDKFPVPSGMAQRNPADANEKDHKVTKRATRKVRLIGPKNSAGLRAMIEELTCASGSKSTKTPPALPPDLQIFSATPSASDAILLNGRDLPCECYTWLNERRATFPTQANSNQRAELLVQDLMDWALNRSNVEPTFDRKFFRTIMQDDVISDGMLRELDRRIPKSGDAEGERQCIAIVSESDTFYGRAISETFESTAKARGRWGVVPFTYLSGIDGQSPGQHRDSSQGKNDSRTNNSNDKPDQNRPLDLPEGTDQSDYLRRLAGRLEALDRDLRNEGSPGIRAVGILGSDVYDKLLIARALRARLPAAIFFSNHLDARMAQNDELPSTHNLCIVSAFGLRLSDPFQEKVAPFRDSYQTAVYAAALRALDFPGIEKGMMDSGLERPAQHGETTAPTTQPSPRVFEIGRTRIADLSASGTPMDPQPPSLAQWWSHRWGTGTAFIVVVIALAATVLIVHGMGPKTFQRKNLIILSVPATIIALALSAGVLGFLLYLQSLRGNLDAEPFAWFEGISIWPTEGLRVLAILMCGHFIYKSWHQMRKNQKDLETTFWHPPQAPNTTPLVLPTAAEPQSTPTTQELGTVQPSTAGAPAETGFASPSKPRQRMTWFASIFKQISARLRPYRLRSTGEGFGPVDPSAAWNEYIRLGSARARLVRTIPLAVLYLLSALLLTMTLGFPTSPARGEFSHSADTAILTLAVLCLIGLTFYVVDASRLSEWWIRRMSRGETKWPTDVTDKCKRKNLHPDDLREYLDLHLIERRTREIAQLIYYPFWILLIMMISRLRVFDDWDWPIGLLIVFTCNALLAIWAAWTLRTAAESARSDALSRLNDYRFGCLASKTDSTQTKEQTEQERTERTGRAEALKLLIAEVRGLKGGAFAPLSKHPILGAILIPSSGIFVIGIVEMINRFF